MKPENRTLTTDSPYYLDQDTYAVMRHYVLMYSRWNNEYNALSHSVKSPSPEPLTPNGMISDSTANLAERRATLAGRMKEIEETVHEVAPDIDSFLLYAVTTAGVSFEELERMGISCSKRAYFRKRRQFYYALAKKISFIA